MRGRTVVWVAWSLAVLTVPLMALHLTWWTLAQPIPGALDTRGEVGPIIPFVVVGALIVTRRPDNRIGWLFCAGGFFLTATSALDAYGLYALAARPNADLPAATAAAWVASWSWTVGLVLLLLLPLLYPTGRLPSPRWRPVVWLAGLMAVVTISASAFRPGLLKVSEVPVVANPLGIAGAGGVLDALHWIGSALTYLLFAAAVGSVVVRFRRAQGTERQQLKWFVYATVGVVVGTVLGEAILGLVADPNEVVVDLIFSVPFVGWPIALGIAVLRYRLYDIDRLINRTLVYGLLTVLLGLSYAACVWCSANCSVRTAPAWRWPGLLWPQRRSFSRPAAAFSRGWIGGSTGGATTRPEPWRCLAPRLRDQIDLDTLSVELLAVAEQTMQPTQASLWIRPSTRVSLGGERQPS